LALGGDPEGALLFLSQAARIAADREEHARCRDICTLALKQVDEAGMEAREARATRLQLLLLRGRSNRILGNPKEARTALRQALALVSKDTPVEVKCEILNGLGIIEVNAGDGEGAFKHVSRALRLARRSGNAVITGECLSRMGMFHMSNWDGARAIKYFEEAAAISPSDTSRKRKARVLMDLAYCNHALGNPLKSLELMTRISRMIPLDDEPTGFQGRIAFRLGGAQFFCSEYGMAYESLKAAHRIFMRFGDRMSLAQTLDLLGITCLAIGLLREAREHLEAALDLARHSGSPRAVFFILAHLGMARCNADAERGIELIQEALQMSGEVDGERYAAPIRHFLGLNLLALDRRDDAEEQASIIGQIIDRYKDRFAQPYYVHLKWMSARESALNKAGISKDIRKMERLLPKVPAPVERFEILWFISDLYHLRDDTANFRSWARRALRVWDEMGRGLDKNHEDAHANHPTRMRIVRKLQASTGSLADKAARKMTRNELDAFFRVSHSMSTITDLHALHSRILDIALETMGAGRGIILLSEHERLLPMAYKNWPGGASKKKLASIREQAASTLADHVLEESDPLMESIVQAFGEGKGDRANDTFCLPLISRGRPLGALYLERQGEEPAERLSSRFISAFAGMAAVALENARLFEEVKRDRERFRIEKDELAGLLRTRSMRFNLVGLSGEIQKVWDLIDRAAGADVSVLISGETGTGKEIVARAIHENSARRDGPYVSVNCAALVESMLDAELFGIEKGTATGVEPRIGKFELAGGGTLFLDEISEMSPACQAKVLRAIQEKKIIRMGGLREIHADCRILAASNKVLETEIREGRFREDLHYRIGVFPILIPPLRERLEDIPLLVSYFVDRWVRHEGKEPVPVSPKLMEAFINHAWPGNVRELENLITRLLLLSEGTKLRYDDLPPSFGKRPLPVLEEALRLKLNEKELLSLYARKVLQSQDGSKKDTIRILGIDYKTLQKRLR
ncbi:sigma 54-interacting transcriptional regulator, partial [Acidobacteriota bacterium]